MMISFRGFHVAAHNSYHLYHLSLLYYVLSGRCVIAIVAWRFLGGGALSRFLSGFCSYNDITLAKSPVDFVFSSFRARLSDALAGRS